MAEVWLLPNKRPFWLWMTGLVGVLAGAITAGWQISQVGPSWAPIFALVCEIFAIASITFALVRYLQPVLAYQSGEMFVRLYPGRTIRVPIQIVEGFLLGKQETKVGQRQVEVSTLAIRLAEKATEWANVDVHPNLGRWCGGYINIFGTWCEPLSIDLVNKLNAQLAEAKSQHAQSAVSS